jgi:hypothetical protein
LASGETTDGIFGITVHDLQQLSTKGYELNMEILLDITTAIGRWEIALIVEKVRVESSVKLNVTCKAPEYPAEIPFMEYFLGFSMLSLHWKNLNYDEKIILVNSTEQFCYYLTYYEKVVDFSKNSVLLMSGRTESGVAYTTKTLWCLSKNDEYRIDAELFLNTEKRVNKEWVIALVVEKLSEECTFELKTKISNAETDFVYYDNGKKIYYTIRKDKVVIQCKSEAEAKAVCEKYIFVNIFHFASEWLLATINPLKVALNDLMRMQEVPSTTYGLEYTNETLHYPTDVIYVEFKEGLLPEEVLEVTRLSERVKEIKLVNYSGGYRVTLNVPVGDIFQICRMLFESGLCIIAEPSFIRKLIPH